MKFKDLDTGQAFYYATSGCSTYMKINLCFISDCRRNAVGTVYGGLRYIDDEEDVKQIENPWRVARFGNKDDWKYR